jgi:hypothetical protein
LLLELPAAGGFAEGDSVGFIDPPRAHDTKVIILHAKPDAFWSASICSAKSWSPVDTRAYPMTGMPWLRVVRLSVR